MNAWIDNLAELIDRNEPCVLLTVAGVRGSAPREIGTKMIVTARETIGTIGGGQLEYNCTQIAVEAIREADKYDQPLVRKFPLGTNCGQCCGGTVDVMFERINNNSAQWLRTLQKQYDDRQPTVIATSLGEAGRKFLITAEGCDFGSQVAECPTSLLFAARKLLAVHGGVKREGGFLLESVCESKFLIAVFGAGHVGAATVDVLSRLETNIRWIDSRKKVFPANLPANVTVLESDEPAREVMAMPASSYYLVMTHSHPLDLEICDRVLRRGDFAYCGLIGSKPKRRRFERLLGKQGMTDDSLRRLICPIGIEGIEGKQPAEIALSVAAEILQTRDALHNAEQRIDDTPANLHVI